MAWLDNTGLYQKFGTEQTVTQAGGEYKTYGELREIEFKVTLASLTTTPTVVAGGDNMFMPAGMMIEKVEILVDAAAATGATIDIGLIRTDRSTQIDYDGLVAAEVLATLTPAGKKITYTPGSSKAGALIGTTTANVGYFTANYTTTAFTAGVIQVRVFYRKP